MGEYEGGPGDVADLAGAGDGVLEGAPAAGGEQREPAFAQAAQGSGAGVKGVSRAIDQVVVP
jgi:hypothetical protein